MIQKCFETLRTWSAKENDETELELHAELWARLARLSLNEESITMLKYSLRCVENSLSLLNPNTDLQGNLRPHYFSIIVFFLILFLSY